MAEPTAVVLANMRGFKGYERGLIPIAGRPMIEYVLDTIPDEVTDVLIAVNDEEKAEAYGELAEKHWARVVVAGDIASSIRRQVEFAVSAASGDSVVILPCDAPLLTKEFTSFLVEASKKFSAVLPRNQAREVMYLMAAYQTKAFSEVFAANPEDGMEELIKKVKKVLYLSSNSLKIFDEKLTMFFRVNNPSDVNRAERFLRRRRLENI